MINLGKILLRAFSKVAIILGALVFILWMAIARPVITGNEQVTVDQTAVKLTAERLETHVRILSEDFAPRDYKHPENLAKSANYIRSQWEGMGLQTEEQNFIVDGKPYKNIITHFPAGTDDVKGKLVLGAHYDAAWNFPGADDNASGTAGLIETARLLKANPPNRPITLVAYSLEEPPFFGSENMGSYVHAKSEKDAGSDIDLMISIEMIGYFSDEKGSQEYPLRLLELYYPDQGNFIGIIDRMTSDRGRAVKKQMRKHISVPVHSINAPIIVQGIEYSDHRNYWEFGYDAIMISDTSFYRNKAYHKETDTADRLDYYKMAHVVHGISNYASNVD